MRKLILQVQQTVDGFMADRNGKTDWMIWNWGDEWTWDIALQKYFNGLTASVDCVLLSRKMAEEGFIDHWAAMADKHDNPQTGFASVIRQSRKVVFTKTLSESGWDKTVLAKGDLIDEINALKKAEGKNLIAYGGASFASSLIQSGLVDEYHFIVNPVAIGSGLSIFNGLGKNLNLSLISATSYPGGMLVLQYQKENMRQEASIIG
jgi:dihydrofolate reductase